MTLNPFNWTAGPFLTLYLVLAVIVFLWGFRQRSMIGPPAQFPHPLNELELAFLAGGARRLGDAVLLCLTSQNGAAIERPVEADWHQQSKPTRRHESSRCRRPPANG